jgi:ABC-type uncharacterized transport system ATPase subunit
VLTEGTMEEVQKNPQVIEVYLGQQKEEWCYKFLV